MKKVISAVALVAVSCFILIGWRWHQNSAPDFADMKTFDPSRYKTTYAMQEFKLKPHDGQWTLRSVTHYNGDGTVVSEIMYQLDEKGHAYYENGEDRIYAGYIPRLGFQDVTGFLSEWDIAEEKYDDAGRIIFRNASHPEIPETPELVRWYYRPSAGDLTGNDAVCTFVRTMRALVLPGEETWMYGCLLYTSDAADD